MTKMKVFRYIPSNLELSNSIFGLIANPETSQGVSELYRMLIQNGLISESNDLYMYRQDEAQKIPSEEEITSFLQAYKKRLNSQKFTNMSIKSEEIADLESELNSLM